MSESRAVRCFGRAAGTATGSRDAQSIFDGDTAAEDAHVSDTYLEDAGSSMDAEDPCLAPAAAALTATGAVELAARTSSVVAVVGVFVLVRLKLHLMLLLLVGPAVLPQGPRRPCTPLAFEAHAMRSRPHHGAMETR